MDIGATEAVDGLFGVADQVEEMIALAEDGGKDPPLMGVGILEFVDQGSGETLGEDHPQAPPVLPVKGRRQAEDQIVVGHRPCRRSRRTTSSRNSPASATRTASRRNR